MKEQEQQLTSMRLTLEESSTVQAASLQKLNKTVRQHSLDKEEALSHAQQARAELSLMVKRADSRIMKLEREKQNLEQGNKEMESRDVERVQSMKHAERVLAKGKRQLQIDQDDLLKQKGIQDSQSESMTHHRDLNITKRKKMKKLHNEAHLTT
jgi:hypothetical protein